ncbi:DUF2441 domain-containing protein [Legionella tunisiensis]|uniref:DUF2441 domain-containing protein n=1 Tax=Legionella tunisiensis TaxID=1034944 RepID=UPI00037D248D|nr:DUF2441 domain-containing protein [Legionella tunisiensis]
MDKLDSGFIFLDVKHPLVAWECYRGRLISPIYIEELDIYHPSIMLAGIIETKNNIRLCNELLFEHVRATEFPTAVSRLKCLYTFKEKILLKRRKAGGGILILKM